MTTTKKVENDEKSCPCVVKGRDYLTGNYIPSRSNVVCGLSGEICFAGGELFVKHTDPPQYVCAVRLESRDVLEKKYNMPNSPKSPRKT